ncbi:2-hydroxyacyl-CoA dehydratase subunit D [Desulfatibacillum aliphaticivorans]|uniref:2-hydroxyglutaryl-CoA dehydratase D-component n=1 Tax=Desulfatibacillum aliphaticivorans TaxID=218208 RepID=B8FDE0_DESAL|nr:2-hydroxyacyl-CoA dehydratase family protein [Desulfatibacillum aliphaticivorans]ACL06571.1 2-hydroxyglutaryl-CoA dehydratase D-component [Desulfatibacillum aliphaticivorans]
MRKEYTEYPFDWALHSLFTNAAKAINGTPKEYDRIMSRIGDMKELADFVFGHGDPGALFMKGFSQYTEAITTAHAKGRKLAFTTFCQSPAIFWAMDIVPIVLEPMTVLGNLVRKGGTAEFMDFCVEAGFTETSCSSQRGALGAYLKGLAEKPDFVAIDTGGICDTNANSFTFAASYLDIPFYQINYPPTLTDQRAADYHRADYRNFIKFLEAQTGNKLDEDKLRAVMQEIEVQDDLICEIQELQRLKPNPVPVIFNLFIYALRFTMAGMEPCTTMLRACLEAAKKNAAKGVSGLSSRDEKTRALFVYIDHYATNIPLWTFMDQMGIAHLGCILTKYYQDKVFYSNGDGYHLDTADLDSMIDALAEQNSRLPMVKQIRGPYDAPDMWLEEAMYLKDSMNADFAVYSGTPGCRNTWGMLKLLAKKLEDAGLPTLIINADAFDERVESWEATRHRFEEFLELRRLI